MSNSKTAILWFRNDLRLRDNAALNYALQNGYSIIPVYILDEEGAGEWSIGAAAKWWLDQSLAKLNQSLDNKLIFAKGPASVILGEIVKQTSADAIFWNRCYEPWRISRDTKIKEKLTKTGIEVKTFKDSLLWEPWEITKDDGTPYKVFTPFFRKGCLGSALQPPKPTDFSSHFKNRNDGEGVFLKTAYKGVPLEALGLLPDHNWHEKLRQHNEPGESGAQKTLQKFLLHGLKGYKQDRNRPDLENVSRLSPHLRFGEISIREVWHKAREYGLSMGLEPDTDHFCSELGWREFSYSLLYYNPDLPDAPLQKRFEKFPWRSDKEMLRRWQLGQTGIPIVDAGMRQLWETGWMHNRVRMIVASLLVKNLLIPWQAGEAWFWDTLVDADLANNAASWQWVAGCGADAAPYFRIFNPVTQGEKFDPEGAYVRRFVPELKNVPAKMIHTPWQMGSPPAYYPSPIISLSDSRNAALAAFSIIK